MTAARDGDCEEVQRLLDDQQWPAAVLSRFGQASGYTALGLACNRGHIEVALLLLERGADPNVLICEAGATPLMIAVASEVGIDTSASRMGNALSRRTVRSR